MTEPDTKVSTDVTEGYKNDRLTQAQCNAIPLFLQGKSDGEVAAAVGKSRKTVNLWRLHDPNFKAELERCREEVWARVHRRLENLSLRALETLEELLQEEGGDARLRRAVAKDLLEFGLKLDARATTRAVRAAAGDALVGQAPRMGPVEVALAWMDDLLQERPGSVKEKPEQAIRELLPQTEGPEEPSMADRQAPGDEAKVQKISKSLRALGREHPEMMPALKGLIKALDGYPEELAVILEKAEKPEQQKHELTAEVPAARDLNAEENRDELDRLKEDCSKEEQADAGRP